MTVVVRCTFDLIVDNDGLEDIRKPGTPATDPETIRAVVEESLPEVLGEELNDDIMHVENIKAVLVDE